MKKNQIEHHNETMKLIFDFVTFDIISSHNNAKCNANREHNNGIFHRQKMKIMKLNDVKSRKKVYHITISYRLVSQIHKDATCTIAPHSKQQFVVHAHIIPSALR